MDLQDSDFGHEAATRAALAGIQEKLGRPLRVLHIGNIANNGFLNARIQRACGIHADCLSADYYHIMGTPEWEEAEFDAMPDDAFFPDWWALDLNGYQRPRWFAAAPLIHACRYLEAWVDGDDGRSERLWRRMESERYVRCSRSIGARMGHFRRKVGWKLDYERRKLKARLGLPADSHERKAVRAGALGWAALNGRWADKRAGWPFPATPPDLEHYWKNFPAISSLLDKYDIVQGYAQDGIWAAIQGRSYAAYEHGTLRQMPFDDEPVGRIVALVYGLADQVFVTNLDCLASADRLQLDPARVRPLPHAFDDAKLRRFKAAHAELRPPAGGLRLIMPSRQDWRDGDMNLGKGNDLFFRTMAKARRQGVDVELTAVEWGRDLDASKSLIAELGLDDRVTWIRPLRKAALWKAYLTSHAVVDQFHLHAFGSVTFEALALGCRVISALDRPAAERFFGDTPPMFVANDGPAIHDALRRIAADPDDAAGQGTMAAHWIAEKHSAPRIVNVQVNAYQAMLA